MTTSETTDLERYVDYIDRTCSRLTVKNWTACSHFCDTISRRLQQIRNTQRLLSGTEQKGEDSGRYKRGLFNFVGKISKTLFGTMDRQHCGRAERNPAAACGIAHLAIKCPEGQ